MGHNSHFKFLRHSVSSGQSCQDMCRVWADASQGGRGQPSLPLQTYEPQPSNVLGHSMPVHGPAVAIEPALSVGAAQDVQMDKSRPR